MIRRFASLLTALVVCSTWLLSGAAAQEQYVDLPFAGVSLVKPEGFEAAKRFDGVENKSAGASIMAMQVMGAFADASKPFQANATLANGVKVESRIDQSIGGQSGCLIKASQDSSAAKFKKWILIFGDGARSQMITANLPLTADDAMMNSIKEAVLKTKPFVGEKPNPIADLPYGVASSKLKPTRGPQKSLVFTKDEIVPIKNTSDPVLIVGMSFGGKVSTDPKEFLEARIKQDSVEANWKLTTNTEFEVGGLKGREIVTQGNDAVGAIRYGYWAVLMSGEDYYLFKGACGADKAQDHVSAYAEIARSFKLKEAAK